MMRSRADHFFRTQVYLTIEQSLWIKHLAARSGMSPAQMIRHLLHMGLRATKGEVTSL